MASRDDLYKLTVEQKKELRRLTQLANRRIKAFTEVYEKEGLEIIPYEVSGGIQTRDQWHSENYALSRSTKFSSRKAFNEHMRFLRSFEHRRENVTEYTKTQRHKTAKAIRTSLGVRQGKKLVDEISKMNVAQMKKFWNEFENRARALGVSYSSDAVMDQMLELYSEDVGNLKRKSLGK